MNGQNVFSAKLSIGKGESVLSIDLPALNEGIYLVKISDFSTHYTKKYPFSQLIQVLSQINKPPYE